MELAWREWVWTLDDRWLLGFEDCSGPPRKERNKNTSNQHADAECSRKRTVDRNISRAKGPRGSKHPVVSDATNCSGLRARKNAQKMVQLLFWWSVVKWVDKNVKRDWGIKDWRGLECSIWTLVQSQPQLQSEGYWGRPHGKQAPNIRDWPSKASSGFHTTKTTRKSPRNTKREKWSH